MGMSTFTRLPQGDAPPVVKSFDSSPKYSICKQFGYDESTFELVLLKEDKMSRTYEVRAAQSGGKVSKIGTLVAKTMEAVWGTQQ